MDLNTVWFIIIAFFFTGYFALEGFDFGVGMLLPFLRGESAADSDARRTAAVRAIGPVWDGNEVWLIVAGASIFAAFPEWYATLFSGFYCRCYSSLLHSLSAASALSGALRSTPSLGANVAISASRSAPISPLYCGA